MTKMKEIGGGIDKEAIEVRRCCSQRQRPLPNSRTEEPLEVCDAHGTEHPVTFAVLWCVWVADGNQGPQGRDRRQDERQLNRGAVCASTACLLATRLSFLHIHLHSTAFLPFLSFFLLQALVAQWQTNISSSGSYAVSPAELLPHKDLTGLKLTFDSASPQKEMTTVALYAATNTIYRDQIKKEIWADLAAGMQKQKLPEAVIKNGEAGAGPAIDMALDKHVEMMVTAIKDGKPLVADEDVQAVNAYQAKKAATVQTSGDQKLVDSADGGTKVIDPSGVTVDANADPSLKDSSALASAPQAERGQFETDQAIRT